MDRRAWLDERRRAVEADYDRDAPSYDTDLYSISATHRAFVARVVEGCPAEGVVLDIPCGTGRNFELVVARQRHVDDITDMAYRECGYRHLLLEASPAATGA